MNLEIANKKSLIEERILKSCTKAGINRQNINILAVSKTFSSEHVKNALELGFTDFGENYVDEALEKINSLNEKIKGNNNNPLKTLNKPRWHFIGPIQSNKTKKIAENFDWVHSIENLKQINRLAKQRPIELDPLKVFIQVNLSNENSKRGILENGLENLVNEILKHERLSFRGLMTIPEKTNKEKLLRERFSKLRNLMELINKKFPNEKKINELSMGMSSDLEAAIMESNNKSYTWLRLGSAVFGSRKTS